jgi:DNA repair exonuclease SbcCD ATPase subunit
MKLRSIKLTNVRRFAGMTATLSGIGDGITILSEPNEFGKSTFFDALNAAFFEKYRSHNATIKSLQPHSGGAPEVVVEIELPEGRFHITKRWLGGPARAQVADETGRLIAQADDAEAWISRLMGGGLAGPSGLLWVRQGLMGLEADSNAQRALDLSARRDLLSSVAGEIDMMTGGRRMDAVIDRVTEALARLATDGGRPKAGGEWKRAVDEAAALAAEEAVLRPRAERLSGDLVRRTEVSRTLNRLTDPADAAARTQALSDAQAAHQAALAHQALVTQAETALRLARLDSDRAQQEIAAAETLAARVAVAQTALAKADAAATAVRARADDLGQRDRAAAEAAEALSRQTRDLRTRLQAATRAETAQAAKAQAEGLQRRLDRATGLQTILDQTRSQRARISVTARVLEAADQAQSELDLARARAEAQAVTIEAHPDGSPAILKGAALPSGPVPILAAAELTLPGFGMLRIDPGTERSGEAITQAEQALAHLLAEAQVESLPAARQQWTEAQRLEAAANQAAALLSEVAPEGLDALRTALARAETLAADAPEATEDSAIVTVALMQAESAEQSTRSAAKAAHDLSVQAGEARAAAEANRTSAERQLATALAEAGDSAALVTRIADLQARALELSETATKAEAALAALRVTAPDFATAEARLTRAKGAVDQARLAEQKGREDLASLNATILALAEEGIEERLATLAGDRAEAEARAARYEVEVRALSRLKRALDEARTKARDAYFGPVLRELQPLLAILYPGAELTIDDQSLLPATLTRNGQTEKLEILSGGTREQVAILTRLAFARLFAAAGRSVPVILDDALVHSDDDRIEAMFDALHRTARDQQILVLTCRQRAFDALGGERAEVRVDGT